MGRRELVMMERMYSKRAGFTAFVKAGSQEVTLRGLQYRRTDRTTAAGIPVFQRVLRVLGTGEVSATAEGDPKPLTTLVIAEDPPPAR
ncbi:hypothetical protein SEA_VALENTINIPUFF_39 [Microbacterium phage ValentiniPuff]|uniref:Uncharacterized protein n=1 Tax=Microbacterium phage ValentiniPuff TaxID=2315705 RepID=A0A386KQ35_9CAUD|nr:hypothetical protein SEA_VALENTINIPUFF_39 [Microbacterium phage ValentiniPuff]